MTVRGDRNSSSNTETGDVSGTDVPVHLAGLVEGLLRYGIEAFGRRNGRIPVIPELEAVRARLRAAAASASGRPTSMLGAPARTSDRFLTVGEAAQVMGVTTRQVRRLAEQGTIIARKTGRDWGIDPGAAAEYRTRRCR